MALCSTSLLAQAWWVVLGSYPFSLLSGYGRPSFLVTPPSGLNFCKFFPFLLPLFWTQITLSSGNWRFCTNCVFFFLQLVPSYHHFFSFFVDWCPLDSNLPFCVFFVLQIGDFDINCLFTYNWCPSASDCYFFHFCCVD